MKYKHFFFTVMLFCFLPAFAYKKGGHEAIEKRAYEILKNLPAANGHPEGTIILNWLRENGYLSKDLLVHSAYPDLSFERQFAQNRQMFHFMAADTSVLTACLESTPDAQRHRLLVPSLNACLEMMYFFAKETLDNPEGASQAGRGTYVLMHIVEDSYSTEHAERDAQGKTLITIKGWELSRLHWPAEAIAVNTDGTLRLLHHAVHSAGDDAWTGTGSGGLSPLAEAAAENVAELLITLYMAGNQPAQADRLLADYFAKFFAPYAGIRNGKTFTFAGNNDRISFDLSGEYEAHPDYVTFAYDRSPRMTLMAVAATGFSSAHPLAAYGLEWQWFFLSPRAADKKNVFVERLPFAVGLSLNAVQRSGGYSYMDNLLVKGFVKSAVMFPVINKTFEPFAGLSMFPKAHFQKFNALAGFDLSWNVGKDWGLRGATTAARLSLGYEADFSGYPATHNLVLKIGFNTFGGRVINRNNRNVANPKLQ